MRGWVSRLRGIPDPVHRTSERRLGSRVLGGMWVAGGATTLGAVAVAADGPQRAVAGLAVGVLSLLVGALVLGDRIALGARSRDLVVSAIALLTFCVLAVWASGGLSSPVRFNVVLVVLVSSCVLPRRWAAALAGLGAASLVLPALYDRGADASLLLQSGSLAVQVGLLGLVVLLASAAVRSWRESTELSARRELALRDLTEMVAVEQPPFLVLHGLVGRVGEVLGAGEVEIVAEDGNAEIEMDVTWSADERDRTPLELPRSRSRQASPTVLTAQINGRGGTWGTLKATWGSTSVRPTDAEAHLAAFAEVASLAVANAATREQLVVRATTDSLTQLLTPGAFRDRAHAEVAQTSRREGPLALVLVDVDEFKSVNDRHGHDAGDRVLREVAEALSSESRTGDAVGRLGGDEFALLLPGSSANAAFGVIERIRSRIAERPTADGHRVTISAGVAELADCTDEADLFCHADRALYFSKERGRNHCSIFGVG